MDQKQRQRAVLAAVIEAYIRSGEPVGSKTLAQALGNTVSSATIRNDMADLAAAGYLEQPHTSAGRIPTGKAYRLYIDELMKRHPLAADKRRGRPRQGYRKHRAGAGLFHRMRRCQQQSRTHRRRHSPYRAVAYQSAIRRVGGHHRYGTGAKPSVPF